MDILKIGACLKSEDNPFWSVEVRKGLEVAAKNNHVQLFYSSPKHINDTQEQLAILQNFVDKKVDAIVLAPIVSKEIEHFVTHVTIPIIVIDTKLENSQYFIGFDDYEGGFKSGTYFIEQLKQSSKIAIVEGPNNGSFTKRVDGFRDATKNFLDIVTIVSANFDEETSYEVTKQLLQQFDDLQAIFYTSDNMAMGGLTAMHELHKNLIIGGFDATHAGKLAVKQGRMISTVDTYPEKLGEKAILSIIDICNGKKVEKTQLSQIQLITKQTVTDPPKEVIQKRDYVLVEATKDCSEFDYLSLANSLTCPIIFGNAYIEDIPPRLKSLQADKYLIVTDSNVKKLYGQQLKDSLISNGLDCELFSFTAGEKNKTFTTLNALAEDILNEGISKKTCLILLGGGVVGNIAGFLAAILMRGIRFVHIPTTVMSQIDSTTGGKQAVNTRHGKNLLGTFYEPEFIYINQTFLETLPKREYASGIAEAIKHGLCQSRSLLTLIEKNDYTGIIKQTIQLKTNLINIDPREKKEGLILVYGHTLGHVIEILSRHRLNHGEAISIGMVAAARISYTLGFCDAFLVAFHEQILHAHNLPITIPKYINPQDIERTLLYDKKDRKKDVEFVLLEDIEKIKRYNDQLSVPVNIQVVLAVLHEMME